MKFVLEDAVFDGLGRIALFSKRVDGNFDITLEWNGRECKYRAFEKKYIKKYIGNSSSVIDFDGVFVSEELYEIADDLMQCLSYVSVKIYVPELYEFPLLMIGKGTNNVYLFIFVASVGCKAEKCLEEVIE